MNLHTRVYVCILGVAVLIFVVSMLRTRRLQERYALLWILAGAVLTIAPWFAPGFDRLATMLGFDYAPALLLMLAVIGLLLLIFQLSLNITSHSEHLKVLTQELGLLRQEVQALAARSAAAAPQDPPAASLPNEPAAQGPLPQVAREASPAAAAGDAAAGGTR